MAVQEQTPYIEYTANGVTTSYALGFDCASKDHLIVTKNGIDSPVSEWSLSSGNVVFNTAPANGFQIVIQRNIPLERTTDYQSYNNSFKPSSVNKDFDWIWWKLQELWAQITLLWAALNSKVTALWVALNQEIQDRINGDLAIRAWVGILLNNIVDSGLVSAIAVTTVDSVDDLQFLTKWEGRTIYVKSYYVGIGKGGGTRVYNSSRSAENDGFLCINGWVLQVANNTVTPDHAGAKSDDNSFDSYLGVQKALSSKLDVALAGLYYCSKPVYYKSSKKIYGSGELSCGFIKTSNDTLNLGNITINGKIMNFDVDAVMIAIPFSGDWYAQNNHLSDFTLQYQSSMEEKGIGLYAPLIALSTYKSILIKNTFEGLKSVDSWMVTWERVQASAKSRSFVFGYTGTNWTANNTSQTFISCWATDAGLCAWDIYKMQYSTFVSCGADHIGADGSPAKQLFKFVYSDVDLVSCGSEYSHVQNYLYAEGSEIRISKANAQMIYNKYKPANPAWNNNNSMFCVVSNSKVTLEGGKYDFQYNSSHATYGSSCSALAYVEGGSQFVIDDSVTFTNPLEEVALTSAYAFTKLGVYYTSAASVNTYVNAVNYKRGAKYLGRLSDEYVSHGAKSLVAENISNLRGVYGNTVLMQSNTANATAANGFPSSGVPYLIQQLSSGVANNSYNAQIAYSISSSSGSMWFRTGDYGQPYATWNKIFHYRDHIVAATTAAYNLGSASITFNNCFLQNAVTVVSDERYKTDISELTTTELTCAIACGKLYKKYKLNAAVAEKGEADARYHFGAIAQEIMQCFTDHGLDWRIYGIVTYEAWDAIDPVPYQGATYDEQGNEVTPEVLAVEGKEAGDIFMVRYAELNCFINAGLDYRLSQLEL